jgi:hypothetical protein
MFLDMKIIIINNNVHSYWGYLPISCIDS